MTMNRVEYRVESMADMLDTLYRSESRRILATLIRLLGDFDLAEDALHDVFRAALEQWPQSGVPANPRAWLVSAGRFKAIDRLRHAPALTNRWQFLLNNSRQTQAMRGNRTMQTSGMTNCA